MKVACVRCKTTYLVTMKQGVKCADDGSRQVVIRCPFCHDSSAYRAHPKPVTERDRDTLRLRVLDDHLWLRANSDCARGRKDAGKMLDCTGCPVADVISKQFCDLARERLRLLVKKYDDGLDVLDNDSAMIETEELAPLPRPEPERRQQDDDFDPNEL